MKKSSSLAIAAILLLSTPQILFAQFGPPQMQANSGYQNYGAQSFGGYQDGSQPMPYHRNPRIAQRQQRAAYQRSMKMQSSMGMQGSIYQPTLTAINLFQDGGVPIPPDAGSIPSTGTFQPSEPNLSFPDATGPIISSPDLTLPPYDDTTTWNAFAPPITSDPFVGQPGVSPFDQYNSNPAGIPPQGGFAYGANPPQPYRFGWTNRINASFLPSTGLIGAPPGVGGSLGVVGVDYNLTNTTQMAPGWILNWTNQVGWRHWSGPTGNLSLPSDVFRLGVDLELETPKNGPYSVSLGINPSVNTDFETGVFSKGFQLDGRGILFMQLDQYWSLGLGAQYWDRVEDMIIPWAGLVYRDDYWEWQLMYPEAKVSLFLGNEAYWSKWVYVRAEYHVEAYGIESTYLGATTKNQMQIEDKRVLLGLKMDAGMYSWMIEGGYVFDRDVKFSNTVPGFGLGNGFVGQIGLRY